MSQDIYMEVERPDFYAAVQGWGGFTISHGERKGEYIPFKEYESVRIYKTEKQARRYNPHSRIFKVTMNWEEIE